MKTTATFHLITASLFLLLAGAVEAQCLKRITALSGTQQFDCGEVTVTSSGSVDDVVINCGATPYWVGREFAGSYTFTFSPPASGVSIDMISFDPGEEVAIHINGAPYFCTAPTVPSPCLWITLADATPGGNLVAASTVPDSNSGFQNYQINQSITTITIEDIWLIPAPLGVTFALYFCCNTCLLNAGVLTSEPINLCPEDPAMVPPPTQTHLGAGDILQYILFSNPADTLGSIITVSNSPTFSFDPGTMETGVTYYIAAIVGRNVNGQADLANICIDFSNAIEVIWWPLPSVSFATDDTNLCLGACPMVTATFTGTPPFVLTYSANSSFPTIQGFPEETGSFQVCALTGVPLSITVQAISLTDAHCTCH